MTSSKKNQFLEFLNILSSFSERASKIMSKRRNQLNMLNVGWDMTIWIKRFPIGTQCYFDLVHNTASVLNSFSTKNIINFVWLSRMAYLTSWRSMKVMIMIMIIFWHFISKMSYANYNLYEKVRCPDSRIYPIQYVGRSLSFANVCIQTEMDIRNGFPITTVQSLF